MRTKEQRDWCEATGYGDGPIGNFFWYVGLAILVVMGLPFGG